MSRSELLLDLVSILVCSLIILLLSNKTVPPPSFATAPPTSTTIAVLPTLIFPDIELPSLALGATSIVSQKVNPPVLPLAEPPPKAVSPIALPPATPLENAAVALRKALVNIMCTVPPGNGFSSISGSGVIVSPSGIILTNTHVAQLLLLSSRGVTCAIRSGQPAVERFTAEPVYISAAWLTANPDLLTKKNPLGTGEHDFALLAITGSKGGEALPSTFPFVSLAATSTVVGTPVAIASYGSQSLPFLEVKDSLFPTVVYSVIKDVFTFEEDTVDVIELTGTSAAQKGSSGGGVIDASGKLIGIITTSSVTGEISTRRIHAITAPYIRRDYLEHTAQTLNMLLATPPTASVAAFVPTLPSLEAIITPHLP